MKEFIVNVPVDSNNPRSKEFRKVLVRGRCVNFSPSVINKYLDRCEDDQSKLEVTDNRVYTVITANQMKSWLVKEKL